MSLPFSRSEFLEVFGRYNEGVWPLQGVLLGLGLLAVALLFVRWPGRHAAISAVLAALWAWMGFVYHVGYFSGVNPMAWAFGAAFLAAAVGFALAAPGARFEPRAGFPGMTAAALLATGLVAYPLASLAWGAYPEVPTFGLPCPTTLFTIGMLAFLRSRWRAWLLAVPIAWSLVGASAALLLGMPQDLVLLGAAAAGAWLALEGNLAVEEAA